MEWGEHSGLCSRRLYGVDRRRVSGLRSTGRLFFVFRSRLLVLIWVIVGVAVAARKHYLDHFGTWRLVLSAILAILLWPLLLLGINLHVHR